MTHNSSWHTQSSSLWFITMCEPTIDCIQKIYVVALVKISHSSYYHDPTSTLADSVSPCACSLSGELRRPGESEQLSNTRRHWWDGQSSIAMLFVGVLFVTRTAIFTRGSGIRKGLYRALIASIKPRASVHLIINYKQSWKLLLCFSSPFSSDSEQLTWCGWR